MLIAILFVGVVLGYLMGFLTFTLAMNEKMKSLHGEGWHTAPKVPLNSSISEGQSMTLLQTESHLSRMAKEARDKGLVLVAFHETNMAQAIREAGSLDKAVELLFGYVSNIREGFKTELAKKDPPVSQEILSDAAIGRLVRSKMISGNSVPVSRCYINATELENLKGK